MRNKKEVLDNYICLNVENQWIILHITCCNITHKEFLEEVEEALSRITKVKNYMREEQKNERKVVLQDTEWQNIGEVKYQL